MLKELEMRLSLNRFRYSLALSLIFLVNLNSMAQEEFLQLDSIVVIQSDLPMSLMPSRSWEYEGHDTIQINAQNDQLVKVRYCAITTTATSTNWAANAEFGYSHEVYDLRIRTEGFNFLDGIRYDNENPRAISANSYFHSRSTTIDRFPNVFIGNGESIYVDFIQEFYGGTRTVDYRIELLYFSYE